jgi:hypothetical protein
MNQSISRPILIAMISCCLWGCAIGSKSTSLEAAPSRPEETQLLKSVGYVFHDEVYVSRNTMQQEIQKKFVASEKKSWVDALAGFTDKGNIFTMVNGKPANLTTSFDVFAKTHPVVDVYVRAVPENDLSMDDVTREAPFWLTFLTFGLTPAYLPIPFTASFTLSMPEESRVAPVHWDYFYDREEYYYLPLLIPMEEYLNSLDEEADQDSWKTEEKRLLLLRFLQDAKPILQAHYTQK